MDNRLSILVYSCHKNKDMWQIFNTLFKKYWSDCGFRLLLLTDKNDAEYSEGFDDVVELDSTWYNMLMVGIEKAGTPYVSLWMDDYLLSDYVKNSDIDYYLDKAEKYNVANIRFHESSMIKSSPYSEDDELTIYEPGTAYSFTTQVGIWSAAFLKNVIKEEWSPWDFERVGSVEVKDYKHPLLGTKKYSFPYVEGVRRGKWLPDGAALCEANGVKVDYSVRPKVNMYEKMVMWLKSFILSLNPTLVQKIQNLVTR